MDAIVTYENRQRGPEWLPEFSISLLTKVCKVPRSSYYDWARSREAIARRREADNLLKDQILVVYKKSRNNYGVPKITEVLRSSGVHISRKKVANLMVDLGMRGACGRKKIKTTRRDKLASPSPDLVNRDFSAKGADQLYVSDLTYIPTKEGWLFLVAILDVFTRRIVGWSMATHMRTELFLDALRQAQLTRGRSTFSGTIFHSDHGSQYTSVEFRAMLKVMGIEQSMGTVGDSYDNALAENLWSLLKRETDYSDNFETVEEARIAIFTESGIRAQSDYYKVLNSLRTRLLTRTIAARTDGDYTRQPPNKYRIYLRSNTPDLLITAFHLFVVARKGHRDFTQKAEKRFKISFLPYTYSPLF